MTSQAIFRDLQFECFDVRLCLKKNFFLSSIASFLFMIMSLMLLWVFSLSFCLVVKFRLFYFLISTHSENSIYLRLTTKKFKNLVAPFEKALVLAPPNFVKFYLFFILVYAENFMRLAWVVKKFEFWRPCFWGNPPFWYPKTLVKFYFSFIFAYLKHFMFPAWKVKKFEFWKACLGRTSHFWTPYFLLGLI